MPTHPSLTPAATHTPGDDERWYVSPETSADTFCFRITNQKGDVTIARTRCESLAVVNLACGKQAMAIMRKRAALLASAPELLAALEGLLSTDGKRGVHPDRIAAMNRARSAISRATQG